MVQGFGLAVVDTGGAVINGTPSITCRVQYHEYFLSV